MTEERAPIEVLRLLAEGGRVAIRLRDGSTREGWIAEVSGDAVRFEHAPSPLAAQAAGGWEDTEERIAIDDITAYVGEGDAAGHWRGLREGDR